MYWLLCLLGALFVDLYCQSSPGAQLRLTVDLPLIFFSPTILSCLFLPLLPGCCCYVIVVFLCTHFCCWRWCTDLCVSFIANPPPGAQLRLTVDLPLIVSRYRTTDIPFAEKPRNIFCYLDKYVDNFWQWFGKIKYTWHNTYQRNPDRITTEALVPIVCCVPDIYICALPAAILSSSLVSLPFSTKNVFHFVHFLPQVCFSTKMPFILFPFFRKFVPPLGK